MTLPPLQKIQTWYVSPPSKIKSKIYIWTTSCSSFSVRNDTPSKKIRQNHKTPSLQKKPPKIQKSKKSKNLWQKISPLSQEPKKESRKCTEIWKNPKIWKHLKKFQKSINLFWQRIFFYPKKNWIGHVNPSQKKSKI